MNPLNPVKRLYNLFLNPRTNMPPIETGMQPGGYSYDHPLKNGFLLLGLLIVLLLLAAMLFGPLWSSYDPYLTGVSVLPHFDMEQMEFIRPPFPPSAEHPLGTDRWGNDILGQILHGARLTLIGAGVITFARLLLGTVLGSVAGWTVGRWPDRLVMGLSNVLTALPSLVSAFILVMVLGREEGLPAFLIALTLLGWTEVAQYVRGELLLIREQPYIEGAESIGLSDLQLIIRHIWPNLLPHLLVLAFLEMGTVLILLAELGFLGVFMGDVSYIKFDDFGETPTYLVTETPEWGLLVAQGEGHLRPDPYVVLGPAAAFFLAVVGFNALGEGLRSLLERSGLSTAFLLKRRMLLAVPLLLLGTNLLLEYTGPRLSYNQLATAFKPQNVPRFRQELNATGNPDAAAALLAATFAEMGLAEGLPDEGRKEYVQVHRSSRLRLGRPPQLEVLGDGWKPALRLEPGSDFTYAFGDGAGTGDVFGPLTFVHFPPGDADAALLGLDQVEMEGRILLLSNPPPDLIRLPLFRGARGVLVVSEELTTPVVGSGAGSRGPLFHVTPAAASSILAQGGLAFDQLLAPGENSNGRVIVHADIVLHLALYLDDPVVDTFPVVAGYLPGYDLDNAGQLLIVLANFDGTDPRAVEAGSVPLMLELARSWHEKQVAPRRSVLFLAWGGPPQTVVGLLDPVSFRTLAPLVPSPSTRTTAIFHLGAGEGDGLWIGPQGSEALQYQLEAMWGQIAAEVASAPPPVTADLALDNPDYLYLQGDPGAVGRATSLALIRLARATELEDARQESTAAASNR